ncbi:MAG: alpha/beta hydrolase family protein [Polyangiaceae bacterium]
MTRQRFSKRSEKSLFSSLVGGAAAAVDRAATLAATASAKRRGSRAESLSHQQRLEALTHIAAAYAGGGERFFRSPRLIDPVRRQVRRVGESGSAPGVVEDLSWRSDYVCFLPDLDERYGRYRSNTQAAVRLFRHERGEPRPVIILIHGYLGGQFVAEERVWPVKWLFKRGLDVALFVLPFHAVRSEPERKGPPPFPGSDPRFSNEGFRQAMGDLRDFIGWLREKGHPQVGAMGMSLGGYTTSLLATLEKDLAFAVPMIPLASLADFARDQGRLGSNASEQLLEYEALDQVHRAVSPLHRPLKTPKERVLIIGAEADRITPLRHARRLADHFDAPLETWPGGHLLQLGRSEAFRRVGSFLGELGVVEPKPA